MGLRDWVSEKANPGRVCVTCVAASMGLRDWVSEKASTVIFDVEYKHRFNGAPRLGLGEGWEVEGLALHDATASMGLRDWVSEKGTPLGGPWGSVPGGGLRAVQILTPKRHPARSPKHEAARPRARHRRARERSLEQVRHGTARRRWGSVKVHAASKVA